jgi:hypothetical protein
VTPIVRARASNDRRNRRETSPNRNPRLSFIRMALIAMLIIVKLDSEIR